MSAVFLKSSLGVAVAGANLRAVKAAAKAVSTSHTASLAFFLSRRPRFAGENQRGKVRV